MENPRDIVISEIGCWLESHGYYAGHIFVVTGVYMYISPKMSQEDQEEFKKEFGVEISLNGTSLNRHGEYCEFEYYCDHRLLAQYRSNVHDWLKNHNFPFDFISFSSNLSLFCTGELSQSQICDFEEEFEVKFSGCSLNCNSNRMEYKFN